VFFFDILATTIAMQMKTERSPLSIFYWCWCCDISADSVEDEVSFMGARA